MTAQLEAAEKAAASGQLHLQAVRASGLQRDAERAADYFVEAAAAAAELSRGPLVPPHLDPLGDRATRLALEQADAIVARDWDACERAHIALGQLWRKEREKDVLGLGAVSVGDRAGCAA